MKRSFLRILRESAAARKRKKALLKAGIKKLPGAGRAVSKNL
jgi:hypothetical protein